MYSVTKKGAVMDYISIKEASEKWNITPRRVQALCSGSMIDGALRFGRAWMIPSNAERPTDKRRKESKKSYSETRAIPFPRDNPYLIHTSIYSEPGTIRTVIADLKSENRELGEILQAQYDYLSGNIEYSKEKVEFFLAEHSGFNATVSSGTILAMCAMWIGDINLWRQAKEHLFNAVCENDTDRSRLSFWIAVIDSAIYDNSNFPEWFKLGNFDTLPFDSFCSARVYHVKKLLIDAYNLSRGHLVLDDVSGLGLLKTLPYIIEPMLSQAKAEGTLVPEIHLHFMAANVYANIGEKALAVSHIDKALALALPDGLLGIIIEYRRNIGSILDDRLQAFSPEATKRVKALHSRMLTGWIKLHNEVLQRNVVSNLTQREREIAKLAAIGLSNAEIGKRLHLELSSVKRFIFSIMNKTGAEKRSEFKHYL